jgi:putative transposase
MIENLVLRQQLSTLLQKRRPRIGPVDRAFWVVLRRMWARWCDAVVIVKPETVIGWHRAGFALYWRWLSKRKRSPGRAAVGREVRDLVRRMAHENGWGAPRIHGELLKLGLKVSERTVSRYMQRLGRSPERRQSWLTFLRNHREVIAAMDFFTVPTATFRLLYVWFAIRHSRREIVHWSVTESPTPPWVVQQLREAFPFDDTGGRSKYRGLDRDTIFSAAVVAAIESMGLEPTRTSYQSPWQNGVAERFVGRVRRDLPQRWSGSPSGAPSARRTSGSRRPRRSRRLRTASSRVGASSPSPARSRSQRPPSPRGSRSRAPTSTLRYVRRPGLPPERGRAARARMEPARAWARADGHLPPPAGRPLSQGVVAARRVHLRPHRTDRGREGAAAADGARGAGPGLRRPARHVAWAARRGCGARHPRGRHAHRRVGARAWSHRSFLGFHSTRTHANQN